LLQTPTSGNPGFDFAQSSAGGTGNSCVSFAASTEPSIDVYDNLHFRRVAVIPVKNPIIGPIKSAVRPGGQLILVGATAKGVVIINVDPSLLTGIGCTL